MSTETWPPPTNGMTVAQLLRQRMIARDYLEHLEQTLVGKPQAAARAEDPGIPADGEDRMGGACFSPMGNACFSRLR